MSSFTNHSSRRSSLSEPQIQLYRFVMTGGPCGGKTTCLADVSAYLRERGVIALTVPEAATILFSNGAGQFASNTSDAMKVAFQRSLLSMQLHLEDNFSRLGLKIAEEELKKRMKPLSPLSSGDSSGGSSPLKENPNLKDDSFIESAEVKVDLSPQEDNRILVVLLCDRGAMDGSAYLTPDLWDKVLEEMKLDDVNLRDVRYNAVFHFVSTAIGKPHLFTNENNKVRHETVEEAAAMCNRTKHAWTGHSSHHILDNSTEFIEKVQRCISTMAGILGLVDGNTRGRKFILESIPSLRKLQKCFGAIQVFDVEKVFLLTKEQQERRLTEEEVQGGALRIPPHSFVRKRSQEGYSAFQMTTVCYVKGEKQERKQILEQRDYEFFISNYADPNRNVIYEKRICFLHSHASCTIRILEKGAGPRMALLRVRETEKAKKGFVGKEGELSIQLPDILKVGRELTNEK